VSNRRTLMAAAAIVLALVAGIGVFAYASSADKRAQDNASFVNALVANSDIAKGTTGEEVLQAGLVHMEKVAKGSVPPAVVLNANDLVNKVAAARIDTKQFITAQTFVSAEDGTGGNFAQSIAKEDLVAVTVTVDADHGVANQIAPGDHVNIATTSTDANGVATTKYMMESVKVLAVGATTVTQQPSAALSAAGGGSTPPPPSGVLTFEVTKPQALQVIAANSGSSKIYLVLLPPIAGSPTTSSGTKAATSGK
jgi:Flp pilus assembly protein CpaB